MFQLAHDRYPESREALSDALSSSLAQVLALPGGAREVVTLSGGDYPELDLMRVDLSGARLDPASPPEKPVPQGESAPGVRARHLEVAGHPLYLQNAAIHLDVTAQKVGFDFQRDRSGRPLLVLRRAEDGRVRVRVDKRDLEALLLSGARAAAQRQGVAIDRTELTLVQRGARSAAVDLRVTARKRVVLADVRAVVSIRGRLDVDDELRARLSGLSCHGEGSLGGVACGVIGPQLQKYDGRVLPLSALSLGEVRLRDLELRVGEALEVEASFGS